MKAIVYHAPREFTYMDVPDPVVAGDEVLIRVRACGLCRTDLHIHDGEFLAEFPLIPGHEISGEVAALGADVEGLQEGQRVVADNTELCGTCFFCRRDQPLFCENFTSHGCNVAGGFAEYAALKAAKVFTIQTLSWREAVMAEPTACAMHGMDVIDLKPGSEVLVFGAGPTGIVLAQLLRQNGAAHLTVAAPPGPKLDLVRRLAADEVVAVDKNDYGSHREQLMSEHPRGFDCVVEATGVPRLCQEAIRYARTGGQVIVYGVYPQAAAVEWSPYEIFARELTIKGSFAQTHCFDRALLYLENGRVKVGELVTHEFGLADYARALEAVQSRQVIKAAIIP